MDIEGILAVGGFWLCMILLIFRGAIKERLINAPPRNNGEIAEMKARLLTLEARITAMNGEILELQEGQMFDKKLLGANDKKSAPTGSPKLVTSSSSSSGRTGSLLK